MLMFTPEMRKEDVLLPDAVFEGAGGACLTLVVTNRGSTAVRLERDTTLGSVVPVEEAQPHEVRRLMEQQMDECAPWMPEPGVAATAAVTVGPPDADPENQHRRLHIRVC